MLGGPEVFGGWAPGVFLTGVQEGNVPQGSLRPHLSPTRVYAESSYAREFHHFTANLSPVRTLPGSSCVNRTFHI